MTESPPARSMANLWMTVLDIGWLTAEARLPHPLAYSVSVPTPQGILSIGGEWQTQERTAAGDVASTVHRSPDVFLVGVDAQTHRVIVSDRWPITEDGRERDVRLPQLPAGLTAAAGGRVGDAIYVAGGDTGEGGSHVFWRLDLSRADQPDWAWESLPSWDGPPRTHAVAVPHAGSLYLFSGRSHLAGEGFHIHTDAHRYDVQGGWTRLPDVTADGRPRCVMAGTGHSLGADVVAIFGGANGEILLHKERDIPRQIEQARRNQDPERVAQLTRQATRLYDEHPGFSRDILTFDTRTQRWTNRLQMPVTSPVTTPAVSWNDAIVIASGERAPGVRTREVWLARIVDRQANLTAEPSLAPDPSPR